MKSVRSTDGTSITFDQCGQGPVVILVAGAFSFRKYKGLLELSNLLASNFTVINYDRRGRGDSGDSPPYAVDREIEDLNILIEEAGGRAHVWGMSSGATLCLRAAARGLAINKLALYEPPFLIDSSGHLPPSNFESHLKGLIASGQRAKAVDYYITDGMGGPRVVPLLFRLMLRTWRQLKAVASTLPYDAAILGDTIAGKPPRPEDWATVTVPTLVINGEKSPLALRTGAAAIASVLPNAQRRTLKGQRHNVSMKVLAPVLEEFFKE